jgi:ribosomal protein S8
LKRKARDDGRTVFARKKEEEKNGKEGKIKFSLNARQNKTGVVGERRRVGRRRTKE